MDILAQESYERAIEEAGRDNYDAAEYYLLHSLEIEAHVNAYATLGWLYASRTERYRDAIRVFRKAIRLAPHDGDLYNDFGALLIKMNESGRALKWFHRALKCESCSRRHYALYNMALIYRDWKRPERSRRYLHLCLHHKPDFSVARELLQRIEQEFQQA